MIDGASGPCCDSSETASAVIFLVLVLFPIWFTATSGDFTPVDLGATREHVLGPPEEKILAEAGLITGGPNSVFNLLQNAELPRPHVTLSTGETITLETLVDSSFVETYGGGG